MNQIISSASLRCRIFGLMKSPDNDWLIFHHVLFLSYNKGKWDDLAHSADCRAHRTDFII